MNKVMVQTCADGTTGIYDVRIDETDEGKVVSLLYSKLGDTWNVEARGEPAAIMEISEERDVLDIHFHPEQDGEKSISLDWAEIESLSMLYDIYQTLKMYRSKNILLKEDDDN